MKEMFVDVTVKIKPGLSAMDRGVVEDAIVEALDAQHPGWGEVTGGGGFIDGSMSDIDFEFNMAVDGESVVRLMGEAALELLRGATTEPVAWNVCVSADGDVDWSGAVE
ncbi:hypothetical protein ABTX24_18885 [Nocardioides sp. NPDC127514]|uniref:hypothetical protein n=1 Tax=unclassified Nocardioides TaxID=2615069 RepID=UPI00331FF831